jgi:hypothetical protein
MEKKTETYLLGNKADFCLSIPSFLPSISDNFFFYSIYKIGGCIGIYLMGVANHWQSLLCCLTFGTSSMARNVAIMT